MSGKPTNTCPAPSYTGCSTSTSNCQVDNGVFPSSTGQPPASGQSFGGGDTSWPDLLPICTPVDKSNKLVGSQVYLVLPASYVDSSGEYRFQRMPTRPSGPVVDYDFQEDMECADSVSPWFNGYCNWLEVAGGGTPGSQPHYYKNQYNLFDTKVSYATNFVSSKQGANVTSGSDTSFAPIQPNHPSQLFQFFYSASVPLGVYKQMLTVTTLPGTHTSTCQAQGYTTCGCNTNLKIPTDDASQPGIIQSVNGLAYTKDNITTNFRSYSQNNTTIETATCSQPMVLQYSKHASMRDGLDRLASAKQVPNPLWCPLVTGALGGITYAFASSYNGFTSPSSSYELAFNASSCSVPDQSNQPSCKYLMDYQDSTFRDLALSIKVDSSATNVWFAQTVTNASNDLLLKSFNIAGRLPGCVPTGSASLPTSASPYLATKLEQVFVPGARTAAGAGLFHWGVTRNLGNGGSTKIQVNNTYVPSDGPAWNEKSTDYATWPDLTSLRSNPNNNNTWLVDMTARVVFFNPWLTDPVRSVIDSSLQLTDQAVSKFSQNCQLLFAQNTPGWTTGTTCDQLYTRSFERAVAFLEYIACLVYSLVFNFNLDDSVDRQEYFDLASCLSKPAGQTVSQMVSQLAVPSRPSSQLPSLLAMSSEKTMTCQQEFDAWCVYFAAHAEQFVKLPEFSFESDQLVVKVYVPPVIHVVLSSDQEGLNDNLATYLNCLLQDYPADAKQTTKTNMVDQGVSVFKQNVRYVGKLENANKQIGLLGAKLADSSQHLSIQSSATNQVYVTSWAWTASVSLLSVAGLLYLLANLPAQTTPSWLVQLTKNDAWTTNPALPVLVGANLAAQACLGSTSQTCVETLCKSEQDCLCDYSVEVGNTAAGSAKNLQGSFYFNNSVGICACLASDSYALGQNQVRANNIVSRCFAKQCASLGASDDTCSQNACSLFQQVVEHADQLDPSNWFMAFNDQSDVDLDKLNRLCHLNLVHKGQVAPDMSFKLDWLQLAASICLAVAVPAGWLVWCLASMTTTGKFVRIKLGWRIVVAVASIVLAALAGLLCYALAGVPKCASLGASNYQPAGCVDRLVGQLRLSSDACQVQYCQCDQAGLACAAGKTTALCTEMGVCTNCKSNSQADVVAQKALQGDFSTRQLYFALGCAALVASIAVALGAYFVRRANTSSSANVALVVMLPGMVALVAFAVLVWQAMTTEIVETSISAARQQKNVC